MNTTSAMCRAVYSVSIAMAVSCAAGIGARAADETTPLTGIPDVVDRPAPRTVVVRDATVWTQGADGKLEEADLVVSDGKVERVGRDLEVPAYASVIDGRGKHVTPGVIDCHSHTAIRGGVNEGSNNITAEVRIADVLDVDDVNLYRQLAGGLTVAHLLHGSANSIGGQDAVIKLKWGASVDELIVEDAWPGVKFALGENPKRSNFQNLEQRYPATRMGVMESIRERFLAARDYMREWDEYGSLADEERERREPPRRDLQLEAIAEIVRGERKIHSHSYRQDEILALLRLAEEFGFKVATFQHVLEGYKVADELAAHGAAASTFSDWWAYKLEAYDAIPYNAALMYDRGVSVTVNSDSPELARRMNLEAAKAVKYGGVPEEVALDFVTLNAARQLGIDHRVGSLEPGKDGDFVVWSGDPLSVYSVVEQTWVDGVRQFDRSADLAARERVAQVRRELIARVRNEGLTDDEDEGEPVQKEPRSDRRAAEPLTADYRGGTTESQATLAIVNATIHTLTGPPIENAMLTMRGGKILAVGAGISPGPGTEVLDASGLHVWPGMIDANTALGLTEIGSVRGSVDVVETGDVNPNVNTAIAVNPDSELIPVTRANGLTHVLSVPAGGLISGSSALIRLDGWTWEELTAATPVAMHLRWPGFRTRPFSLQGTVPTEEEQKKEREKRLKKIRDVFDDARAYRKAKEAQGEGVEPLDADPALEALIPVLRGEMPVVVHAGELRQLESAIAWAEREGVRLVVAGAGDVWRLADTLRDKDIPVIVTSVLSLPTREDEPYDTAYTLPLRLHEAGVRFAIASNGSSFGAAMTRNLPYHAAMAAAFGLPKEEAIRAVTRYPAEILGVGHALGTIERGKSASLIVTDGDLLEIRTQVKHAFIDGRRIDIDANRHRRLYEKYRNRPAATSR